MNNNRGMRYERRILDIGVCPTENPTEYARRYYHLRKGQSWERGKKVE